MIKETLFSLALQCAPVIHPDTVHDIARVESGFNPYAIAEIVSKDKVISHLPDSKHEALKVIERLEGNNARFSVGLMQIYSGNFKGFNVTAEDMLNPCNNLKVAQKILTDCYTRGGSLKNALSCYYSGDVKTGYKKEKQFNNTSYIERITGQTAAKHNDVVVPSTKSLNPSPQSNQKQENPYKTESVNKVKVIYPHYVMRGAIDI